MKLIRGKMSGGTKSGDPVAVDITAVISTALGRGQGRFTSSKHEYYSAHPTHLVYFNATVFDFERNYVWSGDIDVTLDLRKLAKASKRTRSTMYLFPEKN